MQGNWGRTPLKIRLMFSRTEQAPVPLIKLRAPDRKKLDLYLERGLYVPDSIADRYLRAESRSSPSMASQSRPRRCARFDAPSSWHCV